MKSYNSSENYFSGFQNIIIRLMEVNKLAMKINKIQRIRHQRVGMYYLMLASKEKYIKDRRKHRQRKLLKIIFCWLH